MIIFMIVILLIWTIINSVFTMTVKSQLDDLQTLFWEYFGDYGKENN